MKTIVITGSTRGLGFELSKCFRNKGWNIVLNGKSEVGMNDALEKLLSI